MYQTRCIIIVIQFLFQRCYQNTIHLSVTVTQLYVCLQSSKNSKHNNYNNADMQNDHDYNIRYSKAFETRHHARIPLE
jgi:hypothetical protein